MLQCILLLLALARPAFASVENPLVGIWAVNDGFQTVQYLFRSDGRYQLDIKSNNPELDYSSTERGRYEARGQILSFQPYEYFGEPQTKDYQFQIAANSLSLIDPKIELTEIYELKPGSRNEVLAQEQVSKDLVGIWSRHIDFFGTEEYTFRPGGYYSLKDTHEDGQLPPDVVRGRYAQVEAQITIHPYSGTAAHYEVDFFGNTMTLIRRTEFSGGSATYDHVVGSGSQVRAKAAEADAFLSRANWQTGVWEIRGEVFSVDLTVRPDGHYSAKNDTDFLRGVVRGRYTLEPRRIHFFPFVGQGLYSRDNGEFGKVERTRELDYYDGELLFIDLEAISQSVTTARKRAGSEALVVEKTHQAQAERERNGWHIGVWQVNDPTGSMQFTFRPDNRYIAESGTDGVPDHVERGQYRMTEEKLTLAPYLGLGEARGFEIDLYDNDLFLIGDPYRMVVARKISESDKEVIEKTQNPVAIKGERGSILGLWTANLPGQYSELVFRPDGQFRLNRCANNVRSQDYGLYAASMATRTLVYDSRFFEVQTQGLDFYGNTMTIFGGTFGRPSTYTVNLGVVDNAIAASIAADAEEAKIDAQWLARVPIGSRDPNSVQIPTAGLPIDPNPGRIFVSPTVFTGFQLYRRLIPGFVYFNDQGTIKSVAVVNTREWHFLPNGRVLIRFQNYHAGPFYPNTTVSVSDTWGAYQIGAKPDETDILHLYADNSLFIETDGGEAAELTLEDGRRNLFWGKDYQLLSTWASEQKTIACQAPGNPDPSLMNTGISLSSTIAPDEIASPHSLRISITRTGSGNIILNGNAVVAGNFVTELTSSLVPPIIWQPLQTNALPQGPFSFQIPQGTNAVDCFRVRVQ